MRHFRKTCIAGRSILVEGLEARQLMSVSYGTNIILNPGAELYAGTPDGNVIITPTSWTANAQPTVDAYSTGDGFSAAHPQPPNSGKAFFTGGPTSDSCDFFQTIDLSSIATAIDAKQVKLALSAYLGGWTDQDDDATVFINFQNSSKGLVSQTTLGPVLAIDRGYETGMILKSTTGTVPALARYAQVQIHFQKWGGGYNDGQADNLSLVLTGPSVSTGTISGTVLNDANGDGLKTTGELGLAGVKVFFDKNSNGLLDTGETTAITSSTGTYSFTSVAVGAYKVAEVVPATYRATSINPVSVNVTAGGTATANFFVSKTALISGTVLNDTNGDGLKTTGEVGLAGVKVFLDKNSNGLLDAGETNTTTSSTGTYSFTIATVGTYKVAQVLPATYRSVLAIPLSVTVASGGTTTANFFDSQTVLISGTVFNDANGNKIKDTTEAGLAGVVVYLDFNNNGQLDSFELKTTTDASGNYKFVLPFGTYVVRQVAPTGYNQTVAPVSQTLAKGAVSSKNLFGDKHI